MFDSISNYRLFLILVLVVALPLLGVARSGEDNTVVKSLLPGAIKLGWSAQQHLLILDNGSLVSLPKIVKENVSEEWAIAPQALEHVVIPFYSDEEKLEVLQLSEKLGVVIRNFEYLGLYREAAKWLGTRYRWAGKSTKGVDCSGLTGILVKSVYDKDISRSSHIIADQLSEELDSKSLRPGDLVFFSTRKRKRIDHVGVYLGDGQFIHASRKGVVVSSLDDKYYARTFKKAGRI